MHDVELGVGAKGIAQLPAILDLLAIDEDDDVFAQSPLVVEHIFAYIRKNAEHVLSSGSTSVVKSRRYR